MLRLCRHIILKLQLGLHDHLQQLIQTLRLERHPALQNSIQQDPQTPYVHQIREIPLVMNNLRRYVRWRSTLLSNRLPVSHDSGNPKIAKLDLAVVREQNVVQLYISMDDGAGMAVAKGDDDLFEDGLALGFREHAFLLYVLQQVSFAGVLHDYEDFRVGFEYLEQSDDVGVANLLEDIDFLEHLPSAETVIHQILVY